MILQVTKMGGIPPEFLKTMDFSILGVSQNIGLLLNLLPFAVALFACILFVRILHSRSFSETVSGTKKVVGTMLLWFLVYGFC